jgi:hypothetical protein
LTDYFIFERDALRIVCFEPGLGGGRIGKDLEVVAVAGPFALDQHSGCVSAPTALPYIRAKVRQQRCPKAGSSRSLPRPYL